MHFTVVQICIYKGQVFPKSAPDAAISLRKFIKSYINVKGRRFHLQVSRAGDIILIEILPAISGTQYERKYMLLGLFAESGMKKEDKIQKS